MFGHGGIEIKTAEQVLAMRPPGLLVGRTLELMRDVVRPGITTADLDRAAEDFIRGHGAIPSFVGYGVPPFPATLCVSVNDEIVHGIPGSRTLVDGDIVSIDCGAIVEGWHGDAAVTLAVGEVSAEATALMEVTRAAMWDGIAAARLGGRVTDISAAVERSVRAAGSYGIVEDYTGHGIGTAMHQPPNVPNHGRPGRGPKLQRGLVLAIEPMVTVGSQDNVLLDDDWTVATADGSLAAHFEHTMALTEAGVWVLTALDGGRAELAARGVPCGAQDS